MRDTAHFMRVICRWYISDSVTCMYCTVTPTKRINLWNLPSSNKNRCPIVNFISPVIVKFFTIERSHSREFQRHRMSQSKLGFSGCAISPRSFRDKCNFAKPRRSAHSSFDSVSYKWRNRTCYTDAIILVVAE